MSWQNPWALAGLLFIALPVLIHLLGRKSARVQPFPTLRFLDASHLLAVRRTRLSDYLLLALRVAIVALAAIALAQPLLLIPNRERTLNRTLSRAILLDTSASMTRVMQSGETALAAARREADRLATDAAASVLLPANAPGRAFAGAIAWLNTQPGQRELVVVSDFQRGVLTEARVQSVPADIGLRLVSLQGTTTHTLLNVALARQGTSEVASGLTVNDDGNTVHWTFREPADWNSNVLQLTDDRGRGAAEAAEQAALALGLPILSDGYPVAIVYPDYELRAQLLKEARPLSQRWMVDVVSRLRWDALLASVAPRTEPMPYAVSDNSRFVVVLRAADGRPAVLAACGTVRGIERLLLFPLTGAGDLLHTALFAAASAITANEPRVTELEPTTIAPEVLEQWQRLPAPVSVPGTGDEQNESDGRWFWLGVLALLGIESVLRRSKRAAPAGEALPVRQERVA